jgi:hypothetical protein
MINLFENKPALENLEKKEKVAEKEEKSNLEIVEDPQVEQEKFKQSISALKEYMLLNNASIDPEIIEKMTGKSLDQVFESLADQKLELNLKQLKSTISQTMEEIETKPSVLNFFRKQFKKTAVKASFVALMLFLKFAPDVQAMEKFDEDKDKTSDKTEVVKENKELDDGKTLELEPEDFEELELSPEEFISQNINQIKDIINGEKYEEVINNPYLLSSLYYSQKFLKNISNEVNQRNMATKIIGPIVEDLSPEFKLGVIEHFKNLSQELEIEKGVELSKLEVTPLESLDFGHGIGHNDAIDLYIEEGSDISAMQDGLVVLAETGWDPENEASTSSYLGGNTVITYNYKTNEFVRYAHLDEVNVKPGDLIQADYKIGTVGKSGMNAYKPGHGGHLHLEINKVNEYGTNQFVYNQQLQERINNTRSIASN